MRDQLRGRTGEQARAGVVAAVRIVRPLTCVTAALSAVYGWWFARPLAGIEPVGCLLAAVAMAAMMGFAHTVNDIVDVDVDRLGKPARPIPSGLLGPRAAVGVAVVLAVTAVTCSAVLGAVAAVGAAVLLGLGLGYSLWWKNTVLVGNVVVGAVCAATVVFGAWTAGHVTTPALVAAAVIFSFMVTYEQVKTLQDRDDDAAAGLVTLATRHGPRTTVRAYVASAAVLSIIALVAGGATGPRPAVYVPMVIVCLLVPVWIGAGLLVRRDASARAIGLTLTVLRLAWLPGLTAMTLLK